MRKPYWCTPRFPYYSLLKNVRQLHIEHSPRALKRTFYLFLKKSNFFIKRVSLICLNIVQLYYSFLKGIESLQQTLIFYNPFIFETRCRWIPDVSNYDFCQI